MLLFVTFLDYLRDFGITTAVMGAKKFDEKTRSNIFWISSIGGVGVFAIGLIANDLILKFFNLEKYSLEFKCLLLSLLFNGISNMYILNLRRVLKFNRVVAIEIISYSTSAIAAIICALSGLGIWTLVIQILILNLLTLVLSIIYSDWKPASLSKGSTLKILYSNGFFFFAVQYLDLFTQQFPTFILGKTGSIIDAGNFDRGRHIQNILNNYFNIPIRQIGVPIVRARYHSDGALEGSIQKVHRMTLHILLPVYVLLFCQAELIVQILYGDKYAGVTPIFRILMIAAMIQTSNYIRMWVAIVLNQGKNSLKRAVFSLLIYIFCIFPMVSSGVLLISGGYLVATFVSMLFGFWFFRDIKEIDIPRLLSISLTYLSFYVTLSMVLWLSHKYFMSNSPILLVILFQLVVVLIAVLAHLRYSNFISDFQYILKKVLLNK
jgi:PST family polysaccharide transporter